MAAPKKTPKKSQSNKSVAPKRTAAKKNLKSEATNPPASKRKRQRKSYNPWEDIIKSIDTVLPIHTGASNLVERPASIPEDQWELPAGYKPDGSFASLAEVVSKPVVTFSLEAMPSQDKRQLIVERIKRQDNYPTRFMLGVGEVDKERAISEVEAETPAGKYIQESEKEIMQMMFEEATKAVSHGENSMHRF